jgi:hypothetical protein
MKPFYSSNSTLISKPQHRSLLLALYHIITMTSSTFLFSPLFFLLAIISILPSAHGQGLAAISSSIPPAIFCQVAFNKVAKVDGVEQLFKADFYMQTMWTDLALQQTWEGYYNATSEAAGAGLMPPTNTAGNFEFTPYFEGWFDPRLEFVNADSDVSEVGSYYVVKNPEIISSEYLTALNLTSYVNAGSGGTDLYWMVKDFRYIGDFTTPLNLKAFPFDKQFVHIAIESVYLDAAHGVLFYTDPNAIDNIRLNENKSPIIGWKITGTKQARVFNTYSALSQAGTYSRLVIGLEVQREPQYYIMKICLGVILLVLMCIWVFALGVDEADRMMGTLTVFGGIVTFLFVASQDGKLQITKEQSRYAWATDY